jgi:hypothetical protein
MLFIRAAGPGFQGTYRRRRSGDGQQYSDERLSLMKRGERIKMKKTKDAKEGSKGPIKVDAQRVEKGGER